MQNRTITFVSNDLSNFKHHRKHYIDAAVEIGMRPTLLAGGKEGIPPSGCEYQFIQIERFQLHWTDIRLCYAIYKHIIKYNPNVIHLINLKPYLFGGLAAQAARFSGWKGTIIVSVPGLGRLYDRSKNTIANIIRRRIVEFALRFGMRGATVCFETTADCHFWVERRLVDLMRTVVTNGTGIDLSSFHPPEIRTPRPARRVLYAGRLLKAKGLDVFLDAAKANQSSDVEMVVAGEAETDPDAISEAALRQHSAIRFLGKVDDMPALLAETDIVVLPSRYNEGVPRILIEAAACGCVPIATSFPGSRALIEDGETGYFLKESTPDGQANEIALLVGKLSSDQALRHAVGKNASNYVRNNGFSAAAIKDTFRRLYAQEGKTPAVKNLLHSDKIK